MKVLAIGATGFIGRHVVPLLVEQGIEVVVLHRGGTDADLPDGVRRIHGNRDRLNVLFNKRGKLRRLRHRFDFSRPDPNPGVR